MTDPMMPQDTITTDRIFIIRSIIDMNVVMIQTDEILFQKIFTIFYLLLKIRTNLINVIYHRKNLHSL